jgi:Fe-S cluster assembly protein SufD
MADKLSNQTANTITRERVDGLAARKSEPSWLKQERISAWELYLQMPMPTARDEDWRRTEIDSLDLAQLKTLEFGHAQTDNPDVHDWFKSALVNIENPTAVLALLGQNLWQTPLPAHLVEKGVIFCDLIVALDKYPELVR